MLTPDQIKQKTEYEAFATKFEARADYQQLVMYAHSEFIKTLSEEDQDDVMAIPLPDPVQVYATMRGEYVVNTRSSRNERFKQFINMEMERDQKFSSFVQAIKQGKSTFNSMAGTSLKVNEEMMLVVLTEGVKPYHHDTFKIVLEFLEQQDTLSFADAVKRMKPAARSHELATETANKAEAHDSKTGQESKREKPECWDYQTYGGCRFGSKCNFQHNTPGTKRCDVCGGKHRPKFCHNKGKEDGGGKAESANINVAKALSDVTGKLESLQKQISKDRASKTVRFEHKTATATANSAKHKAAKTAKPRQASYFEDSDDDDYDTDQEQAHSTVQDDHVHTDDSGSWTATALFLMLISTIGAIMSGCARAIHGRGIGTTSIVLLIIASYLAIHPRRERRRYR